MKHVTLRLNDEDVAFVTRLGSGDRSAGIRQAIAAARDADVTIARLEARLSELALKRDIQRLDERLATVMAFAMEAAGEDGQRRAMEKLALAKARRQQERQQQEVEVGHA